jgi:non-specific serine/threonine protein kinase
VTPAETPPVRRLGPYEVLGRLGAGGMGEVWLARDTRLERQVALKLLPRRMTAESGALALFRNEALALASLNHPNIATIHGLEEIPGGAMVLVLEHVEGETLSRRLARGPLAVEEALQVAAQVAEALEVAHARGVVHRDLKPGNVMLGPRGLVKVLDFGLAKRTYGLANPPPATGTAATAGATGAPGDAAPAPPPAATEPGFASMPGSLPHSASGPVAGTPGYMSPEQVLAGMQDERTDVFAFGCVLYECLAGRRTFPADDPFVAMAQVLNESPDLTALPSRTPPAVRAVVEACLAKDAEVRPRSMRELRFTLEDALGVRRAAALREGGRVATPHNLPAQATSFVGRQATLADCAQALAATRLLTLTGMGGSGKTRLALHLAESRLDEFPDGVWFVDVAPLSEPERLVESLAAVLGVRDEPDRTPLAGVIEWLAPRRALVLLDNAETHAAACAALARALLPACAGLRMLVTHRESLGVEGETLFVVPTLEVPGARVRTAAEAGASEAVRLFVERARAASPAFELDDASAAAVAEICRRLDGIPLALELAAARVRLLGVEQIRSRLGDRFKLLTRAGTAAGARQRTVLAVIQWSWDHLLPPEQDLMRRLAVFTGGWTLERATVVCSDDGDEFGVLDLLTRLVERALVVVRHGTGGVTRYEFLESVWRFALERFEAHLEHALLRERHLAAFLELAERAETRLMGKDVAGTVHELAEEEDNLLAALAACARAEDGAQRGLRLAGAVQRFWSMRGQFALGQRVLADALARDSSRTPTAARAKVLARAAGFALFAGDYATAEPLLGESLDISRALGDEQGAARSLAGLATVAIYQERYEEGERRARESLEAYERLGNRRGIAMSLHNLGTTEVLLGRHTESRPRFEAAARILREVGDHTSSTLSLLALAWAMIGDGDTAGAGARLREAFGELAGLDSVRESVYALETMALWLHARGRPREAAGLMGFADRARESLRMPPIPWEAREYERLRAVLREALGAEEFSRAHGLGAAEPLGRAMAEARELLGTVQPD